MAKKSKRSTKTKKKKRPDGLGNFNLKEVSWAIKASSSLTSRIRTGLPNIEMHREIDEMEAAIQPDSKSLDLIVGQLEQLKLFRLTSSNGTAISQSAEVHRKALLSIITQLNIFVRLTAEQKGSVSLSLTAYSTRAMAYEMLSRLTLARGSANRLWQNRCFSQSIQDKDKVKKMAAERTIRTYQTELPFAEGIRVKHENYGIGIVKEIDEHSVFVNFPSRFAHRIFIPSAIRSLEVLPENPINTTSTREATLVDWEILPPGWWRKPKNVNEIRRQLSTEKERREFLERLDFLDSKNPKRIYKSKFETTSAQYYVFEFDLYVVADCPSYGNAAFVVNSGIDWRNALKLSRRELLNRYRGSELVFRVTHTGKWQDKLAKYTI